MWNYQVSHAFVCCQTNFKIAGCYKNKFKFNHFNAIGCCIEFVMKPAIDRFNQFKLIGYPRRVGGVALYNPRAQGASPALIQTISHFKDGYQPMVGGVVHHRPTSQLHPNLWNSNKNLTTLLAHLLQAYITKLGTFKWSCNNLLINYLFRILTIWD